MIGFALLGCGRIAHRHADILTNKVLHGGTLVGVCDHQEKRAREFGEKYKIPYFTDLHKMMSELDEKIQVVNILTESGNHAKNALEIAPYQRHVVVEKPMALTLDDADAMIRACDQYGIKLFVVKQNRYNLPVQMTREALIAGRFGKLVLGTVRVRWCRDQRYYDQDAWRGTWAMDGGVFANQASHHVDLLLWMMGEVESVFAKSTRALVSIEAEDTGVAVIKFRNGALGVIEATTATRPKDLEGSLSLLGEMGSVEIGGFAVNQLKTWNFTNPDPADEEALKNYAENPPDVYGFGHVRYLQHVIECIAKDAPSLVSGLEGRRSLELISAIYESIETREEVKLRFRPTLSRLGIHG